VAVVLAEIAIIIVAVVFPEKVSQVTAYLFIYFENRTQELK